MPRERSRTRRDYPPECRQPLLERVRAGRTPEERSREVEPSGQTIRSGVPTIRNGVPQADRDRGSRTDGLTRAERAELAQRRTENRRLQVERAILSNAAAWFAREPGTSPNPSHGSSGS
jgi:transposase